MVMLLNLTEYMILITGLAIIPMQPILQEIKSLTSKTQKLEKQMEKEGRGNNYSLYSMA